MSEGLLGSDELYSTSCGCGRPDLSHKIPCAADGCDGGRALAEGELARLWAGWRPPAPGSTHGFTALGPGAPLRFQSHAWQLELDPATGGIVGLRAVAPPSPFDGTSFASLRRRQGREGASAAGPAGQDWASPGSPLASLVYSTYGEADYSTLWTEYAYALPVYDWFYKDLGKPGAGLHGGAARADFKPRVVRVWRRQAAGGGLHVIVKVRGQGPVC